MDVKREYLGNNISCFVSECHTFGTDAVLLADFSSPTRKNKCCDLGTGCGIIPLIWYKNGMRDITAVEIQKQGIIQLKQAIDYCNIGDSIIPVHADLKELKGKVPFGSFNLVTMNPPYKADGAGIKSSSEADKIARHETTCTFLDVCKAASKLLNFGGRLCMCIRPERLCELFGEMQKADIEPKRLRFVSKVPGKQPWLALVEGRRGGKSGITVMPDLFVYDETGEYSPEMKKIYGEYLELPRNKEKE